MFLTALVLNLRYNFKPSSPGGGQICPTINNDLKMVKNPFNQIVLFISNCFIHIKIGILNVGFVEVAVLLV